jgi:hypothetical protein
VVDKLDVVDRTGIALTGPWRRRKNHMDPDTDDAQKNQNI